MNHIAKIAACAAALAIVASMPLGGQFGGISPAFAGNGNGNGGGGDHGGGNNGGNGGGRDNSNRSDKASDKAKDKTTKSADKTKAPKTTTDVDLGPLNAAHASPTARMNAAPNSAVGKIATYERARAAAMELTDPAAQQTALETAVDDLETAFGRTFNSEQIEELNALLDAG